MTISIPHVIDNKTKTPKEKKKTPKQLDDDKAASCEVIGKFDQFDAILYAWHHF